MDTDLPVAQKLGTASVDYINNVKLKDHQHLCMKLHLKSIVRAEVEELQTPVVVNKTSSVNFTQLYTVLFEVSPSGGVFESRLLYDPRGKVIRLHSGILRVNLYGQTSACIQDKYDLRSFCYCLAYHAKSRQTGHRTRRAVAVTARIRRMRALA